MEVSVFSLNLNTFVQQVSPACGVSSLVSPITRNDKTLPRGHYGIYLSSRQITWKQAESSTLSDDLFYDALHMPAGAQESTDTFFPISRTIYKKPFENVDILCI